MPSQSPARLNLTATTTPFRSSRLATPASPVSPQSPVPNPQLQQQKEYQRYSTTPNADLAQFIPPPARSPLNWLWQCHVCGRTYRLGVTRRCLDDGHYFCSGTTTLKRKDGGKKTRRHRACASEFDYQGWKDWGVWKRRLLALTPEKPAPKKCKKGHSRHDSVFEDDSDSDSDSDEDGGVREMVMGTASVVSPITPGTKPGNAWWKDTATTKKREKDCWTECDYPSACRWGKSFGVATPLQPDFSADLACVSHILNPSVDVEMTEASESEIDGSSSSSSAAAAAKKTAPATDFKDILTAEQQAFASFEDDEKENLSPGVSGSTPALQDLTALVSRAKRRHSRTGSIESSPLTASPSTQPTTETKDPATSLHLNSTQPKPSHEEQTPQLKNATSSTSSSSSRETLRKAYEDLDHELRRGIGRAGEALASLVGGFRVADPKSEMEKQGFGGGGGGSGGSAGFGVGVGGIEVEILVGGLKIVRRRKSLG